MSPTFSSQVLTPLVESSNNVLSGLQNGVDVAVQIPIFGTISNQINQENTSTEIQNVNTDVPVSTGDVLTTGSNINSTPFTMDENTSTNTTFTEQDKKNIRDLCEFGFQESQVIRVYIMANRNKELAASMLYEFTD